MRRTLKSSLGFSLLELMISAAIGAVLIVTAADLFARAMKASWIASQRAELQQEFLALQQRLQTKDEDGCVGPRERLVVIRSCEKKPQTWYTLSNAGQEVPLAEVVRAHGERPVVEQLFAEGNQEVGLNHYEVRSWTGWQHHMTLTLLALWFLQVERLWLGGKKYAGDGVAGSSDLHGVVAAAASVCRRDRREGQRGERSFTLTRIEFDLLEMFLRHPRQVLTREVLLNRVWGFDFDSGTNSLAVYVGYLRRKLEEGGEPRCIQTVRGVGYVLRDT